MANEDPLSDIVVVYWSVLIYKALVLECGVVILKSYGWFWPLLLAGLWKLVVACCHPR